MRKLLIALAATVVTAAAAQPALADDPGATPFRYTKNDSDLVGCGTPYRTGARDAYGVYGYFHDGCTARAYCASYARWCKVTAEGHINLATITGQYMTLNTRLRRFSSSGSLMGWQDGNGANYNSSGVTLTNTLRPNQSGSVQCNGTRRNYFTNTAAVRCHAFVEYMYTTPPPGV